MKPAAHLHIACLALSCLLCFACPVAKADSPLRFGGVPVELTIDQVSERTLRLELSPLDGSGQPRTESLPTGFVPFSTTEKLRVRELTGEKKIRVGQLRITLNSQPLTITVRRVDGTLVQTLTFDGEDVTNAITFQMSAPVLGLGEGGPQFDRRGHFYPMHNGEGVPSLATDGARISVPFIIGTEGWALFLSEPRGKFDLRDAQGAFDPQPDATKGWAELFVVDAQKPGDALGEFVRLTGAPAMPPKWVLGYMQSHRTLSTEADILAEALEFREKQLPCDTFIFLGTGFCPAGWNLGHDSFQLNTNVFVHDAATVIGELHAEHFHVALHVVPLERDYPALHGEIPPAPGETLDAQDIGVYWKRHHELFAAGVDGWWPDEGDWLSVPSVLARHRMYYEGPLADHPKVRPWDLQRNGYAGIARYGGWIWSGDVVSTWKTLAAQVGVGLNSSLSVSPFWGTDIGGFYPGREREYTGELYARWFEFATFCPLFRSHGRTWHLHLPWGWNTGETGPVESRPTPDPSELHNAGVEPVCQKYLNLRYRLLPYNYTLVREACDTGLPLMRALWLQFPNDSGSRKTRRGISFWGGKVYSSLRRLVEKGATSRRVYLPAGDWFDWWTGEKVEGDRWIERPVDLETLPIYARAGSIIPLDPLRQYTTQPVNGPTTLRVYPGADGEFTLYDDDGQSLGYRDGSDAKMNWIHIHWNDSKHRLTLQPVDRLKKRPSGSQEFAVEIVGSHTEPRQLEFRGKSIETQF